MEYFDILSDLHPCSYFDDKVSQYRYLGIRNCTPYFYKGLLERGYRRFGEYFFVPQCKGCTECITIRYLVDEFEISQNIKRVMKKNIDTNFQIKKPSVSDDKVNLYMNYHHKMTDKKGWSINTIDSSRYVSSFVAGSEVFGYEMCMYINHKMIAVSYFDIVLDSMSANYFFYDHTYAKLSLGVLNLTLLFNLAKKLNLKYLYPGFWIKDHASMGYKERYKPFEALINQADIFDRTYWRRHD